MGDFKEKRKWRGSKGRTFVDRNRMEEEDVKEKEENGKKKGWEGGRVGIGSGCGSG